MSVPKDRNPGKSKNQKNYRLILSAVHMVYRLVNSTYNTRELLLRLTRLVCQLMRVSYAAVYLLDSSKKKVALVAIFNGKINILLEKKKDIENIPRRYRDVTQGHDFVRKRLIGLPLVADDNIGAIFIRRKKIEPSFGHFDSEILTVIAEQAVTAIKNLQLYEGQQNIIMDSIKSIGRMYRQQSKRTLAHAPVYFKIVKAMAEKLGMGQVDIDCLHYACLLHDAGAMDVPYEILSKTSQLTAEEFAVIKDHPARSVELIKPVAFLKPVLPILLYHHEKYDGSGYPSGLRREQIPMGARIIAVADAFEAMTYDRPYRGRMTIKEALEELRRNSATQFDPRVVDVFLELSKQKIFRNYLSLLRN